MRYLLLALSFFTANLSLSAAETGTPPPEFTSNVYVTEVIKGGQQIQLSDDTLFDVAPEDQPTAQTWIGGPQVKVSFFAGQEWPYHLVDISTGNFVKAKKVSG